MSLKSGEAEQEGPVSHRAPQQQRQGGEQQDGPWEGVGVGNTQQLSEAPWLDHVRLPAPLPASRVPPRHPPANTTRFLAPAHSHPSQPCGNGVSPKCAQ